MKTDLGLSVFLLCFVCGPAASGHAKPQPVAPSELAKLSAYLGQWRSKGQWRGTAYSRAGTSSGETRCQWSAYRNFLLCEQMVHTPAGLENNLSVYTYDPKQHSFVFYALSRNGGRPRTPHLTIAGNVWTYSNTFEDRGHEIRMRTINVFTSATTVTFRSEYSGDRLHWTLMGHGTSHRVR